MGRKNGSGRVKNDNPWIDRQDSIGSLPGVTRIKPGYFEPIDAKTIRLKSVIKPRTPGQSSFFNNICSTVPISLCIGPAGSGKTFLSCAAAVKAIMSGEMERIILTRPAVEADENLGFLPGGIDAKMFPYILAIQECMVELVGGRTTDLMFSKGVIDVRPFAFMRGSTFNRSFVIADEMSNSTVSQFKCLLTRLGAGSKMVISGDPTQSDLDEPNGLADFMNRFNRFYEFERRVPDLFTVDLMTENDIVRHPAVRESIQIYNHL